MPFDFSSVSFAEIDPLSSFYLRFAERDHFREYVSISPQSLNTCHGDYERKRIIDEDLLFQNANRR